MYFSTVNGIDEIVENADKELGLFSKYIDMISENAMRLCIRALLALIVFLVFRFLINILRKMLRKAMSLKSDNKSAISFVDSFVKFALYALLIAMIATWFGVDAASIVAIVGSAGVAIGLAVQGSLSNFAAGILILLTSPFKVGDYIIEGTHNHEGTVEEIQMFYTKLLTVDNKEIILPNGQLANNSIINCTGQNERKVMLTFPISYNQNIAEAKAVLEECIAADSRILRPETAQIFVSELADHSIKLGTRFFVPTALYWDVYWNYLERVRNAFAEKNIEIPYNQLDVHFDSQTTVKL